jgi:hypothetical protein
MIPISLGGSGPDRANVKNTATITAAAARITRPEWAMPPTAASRASCERSQCSFAAASARARRPRSSTPCLAASWA